jgi:predicted transcriptional regulator
MEHIDELAQVESRAKSLGLSITAVAFNAGVYPNYVSRWRAGKTVPKVTTFAAAMKKMSAYLDRIERGGEA